MGVMIKPPKERNYASAGCISFLKPRRKMRGCIVIIYKQVHISECEEIKKDSMCRWIGFVIHKLISTCMIVWMLKSSFVIQNIPWKIPNQYSNDTSLS